MLASPLAYLQDTYAEATRTAIMGRVPSATRSLLRDVKDVEWYPRRHLVEIYRALAAHHRDTDGKVAEAFNAMGRASAERAIATFLQLVMKVMTVELFARKVPEIWQRDHRGGRLEIDSSDLANRHLVYHLMDVKDYDYIGGALPGFQSATLTAIGCKDVTVESDWRVENPGPENVTCHFRWK